MKNKLIAKKATKIRNAFANNISADIKLTKAQTFKRFNSGGSFFFLVRQFGRKSAKKMLNVTIFPGFINNATSNAINNLKEN